MKQKADLIQKQEKLKAQYKQLIEDAYNFKQTDHARSDFSEFSALKLLNELNQLKFLFPQTYV